jgi:hypothetical protein
MFLPVNALYAVTRCMSTAALAEPKEATIGGEQFEHMP